MVGDNEIPEGSSSGEKIASEMVKNLVIANENLAESLKVIDQLSGSVDELTGYFECFSNAMHILSDMKRGSKAKRLSLDDFVGAWMVAEEETFPDDDGGGSKDDDPDDDDDDPRVPRPEPVGTGDRRV